MLAFICCSQFFCNTAQLFSSMRRSRCRKLFSDLFPIFFFYHNRLSEVCIHETNDVCVCHWEDKSKTISPPFHPTSSVFQIRQRLLGLLLFGRDGEVIPRLEVAWPEKQNRTWAFSQQLMDQTHSNLRRKKPNTQKTAEMHFDHF